jgi:hypothetical protein
MRFVGIYVSGSYHKGGGASDINTLKTSKKIYITFTAYLTDMHERSCFALQTKRRTSLPTVRRSAKLDASAFDSRITSHGNATGVDTATATPCGQNSVTSQLDEERKHKSTNAKRGIPQRDGQRAVSRVVSCTLCRF